MRRVTRFDFHPIAHFKKNVLGKTADYFLYIDYDILPATFKDFQLNSVMWHKVKRVCSDSAPPAYVVFSPPSLISLWHYTIYLVLH